MMVLTVRRVATFFREPWCNSMLTVFVFGWEKQTDRCDKSLANSPDGSESEFGYSSYWCIVPRGPFTVMSRDLIWTSTVPAVSHHSTAVVGLDTALPPSGMSSVSCECMYRILTIDSIEGQCRNQHVQTGL